MSIRSIQVLLLIICWLPTCHGADEKWSPELSMAVETIGAVTPSPDGVWVAYTRTRPVIDEEKSEMVTQIYVARADGSRRFQLTTAEQSSNSPAFSPDSKYVYFLSERSGTQNVWRIALSGGEAQSVTKWEGTIAGFGVSPDSKWLAFRGREKDAAWEEAEEQKRDFRIIGEKPKLDALWITAGTTEDDQAAPRRLFDREIHVAAFDWSPDSQHIACEHWPSPEPDFWLQADISEVDVTTGELRPLADAVASERSPRYSLDGKWLAYVRSPDAKNWAGVGRLALAPLAGGDHKILPVTHDTFGRGSRLLGFSQNSQQLFFTETQGTRNTLMSMTVDGGQQAMGYPATGTLSSYGGSATLNRTGTHIGFARESTAEAVEAYLLCLSGEAKQVSDVHGALSLPVVGTTEVITWESTDGWEIEGLLTYPAGYQEGSPVPLALVIHGGPMGVFTETFVGARGLYPIATFAAKGYAVLRPNPRGSSGYGEHFRVANFSDWGGGDYEDIMSGVDKVIEMGVADPNRLAVMGWSYGGFMTSWVIGQTDRFQAACVGAAVTNLWSFTGTSDILDFLPGYFGGEPWEAFEAYKSHSPMSYVQHVKTPSLILHGEEDKRVPISQGYEFYNALKRRGVETQMVVYPRTPHGPREPKFMLDVARRHVDWVETHLDR